LEADVTSLEGVDAPIVSAVSRADAIGEGDQ
jgi:hypothetical protein